MKKNRNLVQIKLGTVKNTCFVIMPFDPLFQTMYERVIQPTVEELGINCIRGDEIYSKPSIMADIWKSLRESRFVIAELTGRNPNVFYEVGLSHSIGKPIILLTRNEDDVPFDLKGLRYTFYDTNDPFWGENLSFTLRSMVQNVLDESGLSKYLEGISSEIELPQPPESVTVERGAMAPLHDISGNWQGSWKRHDATIRHSGTLVVIQAGDKLSGTMVVTFEKQGEQTIVQEALVGSLSKSKVTFNGVSYTYIRQGYSSSYLLDGFNLELTEDGSILKGQFRSRKGEGEAQFERITDKSVTKG